MFNDGFDWLVAELVDESAHVLDWPFDVADVFGRRAGAPFAFTCGFGGIFEFGQACAFRRLSDSLATHRYEALRDQRFGDVLRGVEVFAQVDCAVLSVGVWRFLRGEKHFLSDKLLPEKLAGFPRPRLILRRFGPANVCLTTSFTSVVGTYWSPALRANFGAMIPEKLICFSGGGAPVGPLIITESPERIWNFTDACVPHHTKMCQLIQQI